MSSRARAWETVERPNRGRITRTFTPVEAIGNRVAKKGRTGRKAKGSVLTIVGVDNGLSMDPVGVARGD